MEVTAGLLWVLGSPAQALDGLVRALVPRHPRRLYASLLVVAVLGLLAVRSVEAANAAYDARPRPEATTISQLVATGDKYWVTVDALVSGPHADDSRWVNDAPHYSFTAREAHDRTGLGFGETLPPMVVELPGYDEVLRHFYVLRDPADPSVAILARSGRAVDDFWTRTIVARVVSPAGGGAPRLVELPIATADATAGTPQRQPAEVRPDDGIVVLTGRFAVGTAAVCGAAEAPACADGHAYEYRVSATTGGAVTVVSSHPPDALPMRLSGILGWDPDTLDVIYQEPAVEAALAGASHPRETLLEDGKAPFIPQPSYLEAMLLAGGAAALLLSWVAGRAQGRLARRLEPAPTW